jgi:precorrin-2 dehydrogenase / sirohydrochlorin ferrochelatase
VIGYPLVLDGAAVRALVVGGGRVAARKTRRLLESGATVRVIAPQIGEDLLALEGARGLELVRRGFAAGDAADALLIIAATDDRQLNARVAEEARALHRLVNVSDEPADGNCVTVTAHRAGELLVSVYAGGVPDAAVRVRDAIAERFDECYADAIHALSALRSRLLATGDTDGWTRARGELLGDDFCGAVERGDFPRQVAQWR